MIPCNELIDHLFSYIYICLQFWKQEACWKRARAHVTRMLRFVPLHKIKYKKLMLTIVET